MAKQDPQVSQLQQVLGDSQLRRAVQDAADESAAIELVMTAGASKGYKFTRGWVKEAFDDIVLSRKPLRLSEEELLTVARARDSANKLCHTESCGGNHAGCC
jgi:hypothetical protein